MSACLVNQLGSATSTNETATLPAAFLVAHSQAHASHDDSQFENPLAAPGFSAAGSARYLTAAHCGPLSRELVWRHAVNGTVLVTVVDKLVWRIFGPSWVENIRAANISYWLVAALDPETSLALGAAGVEQCFNAPLDKLKYKGSEAAYQWGGHHWAQTTWNKVHVIRTVYELGVHVVHSDADVVWFADPLPYFMAQLAASPAHILITPDQLYTGNTKGYVGLEVNTNPYTNINTGVYFMRQWPGGLAFFAEWLRWQDKKIGHDQDGFNFVTRGEAFRQDRDMPSAAMDSERHVFYAAFSNTTAVSFLPPSMFANTYTYVNARLYRMLSHPLYSVHWVWGGSTMESKRQNMRDAMKFHDEPGYYSKPYLLTFDLHQLEMPADYNSWMQTEEMIRFHVAAANHQLQQAYWAFAAALITNRTLVLPRFQCYCSKNWYQTQRCRINFETASTFPFVCSLSQLMRVKRLQQGLSLPGNTEYSGHRVFVREYSFLDNPKVPQDIKKSFIEVVPSDQPRSPGLRGDGLLLAEEPAARGYGWRATVAAPLADWELRAVLARYQTARVLHFPQPGRTLSGFSTTVTQAQFDEEIQKRVAYWCCRSPPDMMLMNLTDKVQLVALPPSRYRSLPRMPGSSYLHELGPVARMAGQN
ncbi:hypothetical protein GPECTOR_141g694 [Gonium pectorale]|uniref:Nucleotide-diphospho-sugar transferase domain-containing protein n=1 Tax=Gonium pectorale TaxID=33097 RepID=A0A150FY17_GONPE|nr:hypothetical protein GPECTOR_141g694 [Gonium pectorale]|eukprot:KXZ42496.1 hypothetical protein GPECTOR_141g694 [Gonium pectorale]